MFLLYLFALFCLISANDNNIICTFNHTVEMESDKIYFFETPDFPRMLSDDEGDECYINFKVKKSELLFEKNRNIIFVITSSVSFDGDVFRDSMDMSCYDFEDNPFDFALQLIGLIDYFAIRGYTYYDDWGSNDCPLESISRENPFIFADTSQIILIQSTYDLGVTRKSPCLWQFKAPENYGFKIYISSLNISKNTFFQIKNSRGVDIMNESNARSEQTYYSLDNYLKIHLSKNNSDSYTALSDSPEFKAYITIIKNFWSDNSIDCTVKKNETFTYWSFWNNITGYPSNSKCNFTLTIFPYTEVIAKFTKMAIESGAEKIIYYDFNNSEPYDAISQINNYGLKMSFDAIDENTERNVLWKFTTDGSLESLGFEIQFETKRCNCSNPNVIVSCKGKTEMFLMNEDDSYYCGNMECNFTIQLNESCTKNVIEFSYTFYNEIRDIFHVIRIISNNQTIFELNNLYSSMFSDPNGYNPVELPSSSHNILQVITSPSPISRHLKFTFIAKNVSTVLPDMVLNETKPYFLYDVMRNSKNEPFSLMIELSKNFKDKNYSIEILIFAQYNWNALTFFKDKNMSFPLNFENCFIMVSSSVYKCKTNLQYFVVLQMDSHHNSGYFMFQVSNGITSLISDGCVFKNNVFNLRAYKKPITAMSKKNKTCIIFFSNIGDQNAYDNIIDNNFIKKLWISPNSNGTIKIDGGFEENMLALIEAKSAFEWNDLYSPFYNIETPPDSAIYITPASTKSWDTIFNISTHPYKTIGTRLFYGQYIQPFYMDVLFKIIVNSFYIKLTLLDFEVSKSNKIYIDFNNTQIKITADFQPMIFSKGDIVVFSKCFEDANNPCDIRMLIETIDA